VSDAPGIDELVMANLLETLRAIPEVRGVSDGAPREYDQKEPFRDKTLPHLWCWEGIMEARLTSMNNIAFWALPFTIEAVFRYEAGDPLRALRPYGRRLRNTVMRAIMKDPFRGKRHNSEDPLAFDTLITGLYVGRLDEHPGHGGLLINGEVQVNSSYIDLSVQN
jgi:hypothetical protein